MYNAGPSTTDVIIDMNGYFAPADRCCGAGDHERDDGERDGGNRLLVSDHSDKHADQLRGHGTCRRGCRLNTGTGLISGTPTAAGTSTVTLGATNAGGTGNATLTLTITVAAPVITSATTASGTVGDAFSYQITATNTPTSYGATGLPAGLSVDTGTGLISGTPTAAGTSTVTLERDQRQAALGTPL